MWRMGVFEFLRNLKRNMILAFIFAFVSVIITSIFSLYNYEGSRLAPFEMLEGEADCLIPEQYGDLQIDASLVEKEYRMYQTQLKTGDCRITGYVYEPWVYRYWCPRLREGGWITESKGDEIGIVIGGLTDNYSIGDIIPLENGYQCRIIGILQTGTEIFGKEGGGFDATVHNNYKGFYWSPEIQGIAGVFGILSKEDADRVKLSQTPDSWLIMKFDADLENEQKSKLSNNIFSRNENVGMSYVKFLAESKLQESKNTLGLRGISITGMILVLMLNVVSIYVVTKENMAIYGIYSLIGAGRKKIVGITYFNVCGTVICSLVMYRLCSGLLSAIARKMNLVFSVENGIGFVLLIYLLLLITPLLSLCICFFGKTPVEIIRGEKI